MSQAFDRRKFLLDLVNAAQREIGGGRRLPAAGGNQPIVIKVDVQVKTGQQQQGPSTGRAATDAGQRLETENQRRTRTEAGRTGTEDFALFQMRHVAGLFVNPFERLRYSGIASFGAAGAQFMHFANFLEAAKNKPLSAIGKAARMTGEVAGMTAGLAQEVLPMVRGALREMLPDLLRQILPDIIPGGRENVARAAGENINRILADVESAVAKGASAVAAAAPAVGNTIDLATARLRIGGEKADLSIDSLGQAMFEDFEYARLTDEVKKKFRREVNADLAASLTKMARNRFGR